MPPKLKKKAARPPKAPPARPAPVYTTGPGTGSPRQPGQPKGGVLKPPRGKKTVAPGFKNYGQQRSSEVHARNTVRKAAKRAVTPSQATRTKNRLAVTGPVKGVSAKGGFTKQENRRVRRARRLQKNANRRALSTLAPYR